MRFLQHFLPGKPLETNGHASAGVLATLTFDKPSSTTIFGADFELADLFLEEEQAGPAEGSPQLVETRPRGRHYDYTVSSTGVAAYVQTVRDLGSRTLVSAGLRAELLRYAYDNRMLAGNTRDDGTECGFGGCLYSRPADRDDRFFNVAPNLSLNVRVGPHTALYARVARGFRAPQATELYRLQSGQEVADLGSERLDSVEAGLHRRSTAMAMDVAVFAAEKRGSVYRDSEGFNVSGGRSRHRGIETELDWTLSPGWSLAVDATFAHHTYDFDAVAAQGEAFVSGRDVDTAPRWFGSVELSFAPGRGVDAALQWTGIGGYFLDAENRFRYPGHAVANLRVGRGLGRHVHLRLRINNLADRAIADRADYAFGNYRYFPGRGREFFAELRYVP
jgi:outer membrane receptor protein involved in Fe transport